MVNQFARTLVFLPVFAAQAAYAQVTVDVSKITCEQFIVLPKANSIAIWLGGYYNGDRHDSVIDVNRFEESARNLQCGMQNTRQFQTTDHAAY